MTKLCRCSLFRLFRLHFPFGRENVSLVDAKFVHAPFKSPFDVIQNSHRLNLGVVVFYNSHTKVAAEDEIWVTFIDCISCINDSTSCFLTEVSVKSCDCNTIAGNQVIQHCTRRNRGQLVDVSDQNNAGVRLKDNCIKQKLCRWIPTMETSSTITRPPSMLNPSESSKPASLSAGIRPRVLWIVSAGAPQAEAIRFAASPAGAIKVIGQLGNDL